MIIEIPGDCPTSISKALAALHDLVVHVREGEDGDGTDYLVKTAVETDPPGRANLLGHPWDSEGPGGVYADLSTTVIIPVTPDTIVTVY